LNISCETNTLVFTATVCSNSSRRKVVYAFDNLDFLFVDKKDIILNQIQACEKLLKYAVDKTDNLAIEKEIDELKSSLDLIH
jgi:hypothetical protein